MEPSLEMKRPFAQKWGWEGSALELFKDLQTLLITSKEVFLKALLKELRTHPLFQGKCSNKFWSQTLNAKFHVHNIELMSLFCTLVQCQTHQSIKDLLFTIRFVSRAFAVLTAFLTKKAGFTPDRGKCIFTNAISILISKALALTSCLVTLSQVIFHSTDQAAAHSKLYSRRQPCIFFFFPLWTHQGSKQTFHFFLP